MPLFRITSFLLIAISLFCFSFIGTHMHSEQSISEDNYMFQQGNVFEYDVTFTYPGDSITKLKRFYKIAQVYTNNDVTKASVVYYSGSFMKQEKTLCIFDMTRKDNLTVIDALHLASVYADDSVSSGKDRISLNYPDSAFAGRKFSNIEQKTPTEYFVIKTTGKRSGSVAGASKEYQKKYSVMGVENRTVLDTATIILPFDTLHTYLTYFDVLRKNVTIATSDQFSVPGERTEEIVKRIHVREWYHPLYGIVKRNIQDFDEDVIVTMDLRTIYVP
jgi:hypothetical protein